MAMGRRKRSVQGLDFRMLLIGYFEGMDSERGIAWRIPIRLRLRGFWAWSCSRGRRIHSSVSRTRRRLDVEDPC
jgi:transposase